jgi:hypothetical protein
MTTLSALAVAAVLGSRLVATEITGVVRETAATGSRRFLRVPST